MDRTAWPVLVPLTLLAALFLLVVACSGSQPSVNETPADYTTQEVPARWSVANAESLATLVSSSDAVFIGTVTRQTGQRTETSGLAVPLGPPDSDQPASGRARGFPVSVFDVHVSDPLVGGLAVGQTVTMEQLGGIVPTDGGQDVRVVLEGDTPLTPGREYLFFATIKPNGTYSSTPYAKIPILEGNLSVDARWANLPAIAAINGQRADYAAQEIRNAQ